MQIGPDLLDTSQATLGKFNFDFSVFVREQLLPVVLQDLQDLELLVWMELADLLLEFVGFLQRQDRWLVKPRLFGRIGMIARRRGMHSGIGAATGERRRRRRRHLLVRRRAVMHKVMRRRVMRQSVAGKGMLRVSVAVEYDVVVFVVVGAEGVDDRDAGSVDLSPGFSNAVLGLK